MAGIVLSSDGVRGEQEVFGERGEASVEAEFFGAVVVAGGAGEDFDDDAGVGQGVFVMVEEAGGFAENGDVGVGEDIDGRAEDAEVASGGGAGFVTELNTQC